MYLPMSPKEPAGQPINGAHSEQQKPMSEVRGQEAED